MDLFKYYKFPFKCCPDHLIDSEEQLLATIHNKYKKNYYFVSIALYRFCDAFALLLYRFCIAFALLVYGFYQRAG